ncbi:hypothetical protein EFE42_08495 [Methanohalophilus sp. RSK]|nr:hypothetical protein EFE42_08495 [Methanohalophilus sp. RSK]
MLHIHTRHKDLLAAVFSEAFVELMRLVHNVSSMLEYRRIRLYENGIDASFSHYLLADVGKFWVWFIIGIKFINGKSL